MKVSHELPLSLMHHAYEWNDYDYCLPHLLDKSQQYKLFFTKAKKDKRFIIMDNGLFEGVNHTTEDLLEKINFLQPDIFIVPDAWNDSIVTIRNAKHWMINYKNNLPEGVNLMAVCQGKDKHKLIRESYHHHLLGCSLPQEFMAYGDWKFIKSVDTSNPILVGAEGEKYSDSGLAWKPKEKLEYYFEKDLADKIEDIKFNVQKFKSYVR